MTTLSLILTDVFLTRRYWHYRYTDATWLVLLLLCGLLITGLLKHKHKLIVLGDSITYEGSQPGGFLQFMQSALGEEWLKRHELLGKGIGGNKIGDLLMRLRKDVITLHPTLVVINIGINDVWHRYHPRAVGTATDVFVSQYRELIGTLRKTDPRIVLCTTTRPDPGAWTDEMMEELAFLNMCIEQLAREEYLPVCDLYTAFHQQLQPATGEPGRRLTRDGVHLNEEGNRLVAAVMLPYLASGQP